MAKNRVWMTISHTLPAQSSNLLVYVWIKLKEIGIVPLRQGVAFLLQSSPMVK